jgi:hypothetical protein
MVIPGTRQVGRATAALVWGAIVLVLADFIGYQVLLRSQGDTSPDSVATVPFVSGYMLVMAALLCLSLVGQPRLVRLRPAMLASAAAGLLVLGFFGAFSIGVPLFLAGILTTIAAIRALAARNSKNAMLSGVAGAVIALIVLVGGFEVTQRIIVCPSTGSMGGGGSGFLTGAYSYTCVNGTLTLHSGDCNGVQGFDANGNPISSNGC